MSKPNFLLGRGERLTKNVIVRRGGGPKQAPYSFAEAKGRLAPMLAEAVSIVDDLPDDACPRDEAVITLTLNPEYIAKSYFPAELLQGVGIEVVGSRPRKVTPEKRSRDRVPQATLTTDLFTRGPRRAFRDWCEVRGARLSRIGPIRIAAPKGWSRLKRSLPQNHA